MLVDGGKLIERQLNLKEKAEVRFPDGRKTVLTPVRFVPQLADPTMALRLDGAWRIAKWPFRQHESKLAAPATADRSWPTITQPGKVFYFAPEACPDDIPRWDRVGLAHIASEDGAVIRRRAAIPRAWKGKRIYLRFDSIYPAGRVYLNGKLLGEHASGLTPVEWDVTDLVSPGNEALVAVRLLRKHRFVKMDMPRHACEFAGLAQSACFHATDLCQIADHYLVSSLDPSCTKGRVEGTVSLANHATRQAEGRLQSVLTDASGKQVAARTAAVKLAPGERRDVPVSLSARKPKLWNDEYPNLYTVALKLVVRGRAEQVVCYRTGFRRLDFVNDRPLLNGNPVKFRGVNHLTYHPDFGLYTPEGWLRRNLLLMKRANVNAIRTHYLGPRPLADLCDELGIYLLQELPIDWGTNYIHDVEWVGPALQRIAGGILRDRHHPSVMVWSIGNENLPESGAVSADGFNHLRIYERFAKILDGSRPTMFPPPGPANKIEGIFELRVGDIADAHYSFKLAKDFQATGRVTNPRAWTGEMETTTREEAKACGWSGVWFSSEYGLMNMMPDLLNAPYNSIIDDVREDPLSGKNSLQVFMDRLRREWGYMRSDPTCLGGAYFPWLCAGAGRNPWGWVVWAEDNDWGVVTADLLPKPFFWALRVLFSPVWFPERLAWNEGETVLRFEVANQFNAVDLKDCTLRTQMSWGLSVGRRWVDVRASCPPGETREIEIPIWNKDSLKSLREGHATLVRVSLLAPGGFRPLTADIFVLPQSLEKEQKPALAIGPDAVL
jgi:hypothetical protein